MENPAESQVALNRCTVSLRKYLYLPAGANSFEINFLDIHEGHLIEPNEQLKIEE